MAKPNRFMGGDDEADATVFLPGPGPHPAGLTDDDIRSALAAHAIETAAGMADPSTPENAAKIEAICALSPAAVRAAALTSLPATPPPAE